MRTTIALLFLLAVSNLLNAQVRFRTGDVTLDGNLNQINISANVDFGKFRTELSVAYNIPENKIDYYHAEMQMEPAEIYYTLEVSRVCHKPVDDVIVVYRNKHGKGWGKIAKELGIKPGSAEFHELKQRVQERSARGDYDDRDNGKGNHGKGKGHGNGNGNGGDNDNNGNGNGNGNGHGKGHGNGKGRDN